MTAAFLPTLLLTIRRIVRVSTPQLTILIFFGSLPIWSQANGLQNQLNSAYKGKNLFLRGFYSSNNLAYDRNGLLRGPSGGPGSWTLAEVEIRNLGVGAQGIEIIGDRMGVLYKGGKPTSIKVGKLKIHIDGDSQSALDSVLPRVFVNPKEDLRPLLPNSWKYFTAGTDRKSRVAAWATDLQKGPFPPVDATDVIAGKVKAPVAVSAPDPKYTKEAASEHIAGVSVLSAVVDTAGGTKDVVIIQPLGMGLDEQAVIAVQHWHFTPASLNGQAIPAKVNIEINFRCCP
jgi:TonB family protein